MHKTVRAAYNAAFNDEKYQKFLNAVYTKYNHKPAFRISETPVFVPNLLKEKLFTACNEIADTICRPDFKELSKGAILPGQFVPGEDNHTTFLQMDFGITLDENGELDPQLIEVQGFPSLYFFQHLLSNAYIEHFDIPSNYSHLFEGYDDEKYIELLRRVIVGDSKPENVILLEIEPHTQTTQIDFWAAKELIGINTICISKLKKEGRDLYYINEQGKKVGVEKICNRVIFDELAGKKDLPREFDFSEEINAKWIGHPHWFFRISKHTLPYLKSRYNPTSYFLSDLDKIPDDLHNYVLKPLYSFAGTGVLININKYDLDSIEDRENYILQRKVEYAPVVETPNQPAKCEIRMLMLWEEGAARPLIINNLTRLSKGEMIGVRYNKNKDWVGASVGLFER